MDIDQALQGAQTALPRRINFVKARKADKVLIPTSLHVKVLNPPAGGSQRNGAAAAAADGSVVAVSSAGADEDNLPPPPSRHLFPPEALRSLLEWREIRGAGPGLSNLGNTCFMNAVLQCLAYTPPLANACLDRTHSQGCHATGYCLYCELETHVRAVHQPKAPRAIAPRAIARRLRSVSRAFRPGRQEDAHEFLIGLLQRLQEAALLPHGGEERVGAEVAQTTELMQTFGGTLRSRLRCAVCERTSTSYEGFVDLALELRGASSVERALRAFTPTPALTPTLPPTATLTVTPTSTLTLTLTLIQVRCAPSPLQSSCAATTATPARGARCPRAPRSFSASTARRTCWCYSSSASPPAAPIARSAGRLHTPSILTSLPTRRAAPRRRRRQRRRRRRRRRRWRRWRRRRRRRHRRRRQEPTAARRRRQRRWRRRQRRRRRLPRRRRGRRRAAGGRRQRTSSTRYWCIKAPRCTRATTTPTSSRLAACGTCSTTTR